MESQMALSQLNAEKILWHGVDTVKIGYMVRWASSDMFSDLDRLKKEAQQSKSRHSVIAELGVEKRKFIVLPHGAKALTYGFVGGGMVIYIGRTLAPVKGQRGDMMTNVRVEFHPESVAFNGMGPVHQSMIDLIKEMGGTCLDHKISELHLTCDVETNRPHIPEDYGTNINQPYTKVRSRAKSRNNYVDLINGNMSGRQFEGINVGKDGKMLRIYDKILELKAHPDKDFERQLWHCDAERPNPAAVVRVEYQLRREALLENNINTVEDFIRHRTAIWNKCTVDFVEIVEKDNPNISRCSLAPWWQVVQKAWDDAPPSTIRKRIPRKASMWSLMCQGIGMVKRIGREISAGEGRDYSYLETVEIMKNSWEMISGKKIDDEMRRESSDYKIKNGERNYGSEMRGVHDI